MTVAAPSMQPEFKSRPAAAPCPGLRLWLTRLLLTSLAGLLCSCAVTTEFDDGKPVSRTIGFGVHQSPSCASDGHRIVSQMLGLGLSDDRAVLGLARDDVFCLPLQTCTAIFFVEDTIQSQAIRELFPDLPTVCLVGNPSTSATKEG